MPSPDAAHTQRQIQCRIHQHRIQPRHRYQLHQHQWRTQRHERQPLDGGTNVMSYYGEVNIPPAVDAVEEFKVQSGTMSAEFGFTAGGVINWSPAPDQLSSRLAL